MAKALQPYVSFTIEGNENIFFKSKIFTIDSMITDNGQESAMFVGNLNTFYYMNLHDFW